MIRYRSSGIFNFPRKRPAQRVSRGVSPDVGYTSNRLLKHRGAISISRAGVHVRVSRQPHGTVAKTTDALINCHRGLLTKRAPLPLNGQRRAINIAGERRRGIAGPRSFRGRTFRRRGRSPIAVRGSETHRTADKNRPTSVASFFPFSFSLSLSLSPFFPLFS